MICNEIDIRLLPHYYHNNEIMQPAHLKLMKLLNRYNNLATFLSE